MSCHLFYTYYHNRPATASSASVPLGNFIHRDGWAPCPLYHSAIMSCDFKSYGTLAICLHCSDITEMIYWERQWLALASRRQSWISLKSSIKPHIQGAIPFSPITVVTSFTLSHCFYVANVPESLIFLVSHLQTNINGYIGIEQIPKQCFCWFWSQKR